jgi:hypothetical protein
MTSAMVGFSICDRAGEMDPGEKVLPALTRGFLTGGDTLVPEPFKATAPRLLGTLH